MYFLYIYSINSICLFFYIFIYLYFYIFIYLINLLIYYLITELINYLLFCLFNCFIVLLFYPKNNLALTPPKHLPYGRAPCQPISVIRSRTVPPISAILSDDRATQPRCYVPNLSRISASCQRQAINHLTNLG